MRNFIKKLAFTFTAIFIFLLISFLILEIARRFENPHGPVIELFSITQKGEDYLFEPNTTMIHTSPDTGEKHVVHINNFGYRGKDFTAQKPKELIRIFAVGDSFTFSVGMADDQALPFLIEKGLKEQNSNIEVINAGIGHTSPITHYQNVRKIHLKYHPDMVLLFFDFTDLWDDWHSERSAIFNAKGEIERFDLSFINGKRSWWRTCTYVSSACRYIDNKIVRSIRKIQALGLKDYIKTCKEGKRAKAAIINSDKIHDEDILLEYDGLLMLRGRPRKELIDKNFIRTAKYIKKLRDLLAEKNIPLILIAYPHGLYIGADEWNKGRETWGFEPKLYTDYYGFEVLESFAKENNIPFINTLDAFLKADKSRKYYYEWDGHLNPEGNKILAQAVLSSETLKKQLGQLLPAQNF